LYVLSVHGKGEVVVLQNMPDLKIYNKREEVNKHNDGTLPQVQGPC
jgi:hypothetical protein